MISLNLIITVEFFQICLFNTLRSIRRQESKWIISFGLLSLLAFGMVILVIIPHPYFNDIVYTFTSDGLLLLLYGILFAFLLIAIGGECLLLLRKRHSALKSNP